MFYTDGTEQAKVVSANGVKASALIAQMQEMQEQLKAMSKALTVLKNGVKTAKPKAGTKAVTPKAKPVKTKTASVEHITLLDEDLELIAMEIDWKVVNNGTNWGTAIFTDIKTMWDEYRSRTERNLTYALSQLWARIRRHKVVGVFTSYKDFAQFMMGSDETPEAFALPIKALA